MPAFYLTLVAVLLSGFAARDQVLVASLTRLQGARPMVLILAAALAIATAALAAWGGSVVAPALPPPARTMLAAMALGLAGLESLVIAPKAASGEPTQSLGALALVLASQQMTDAARFLIFAVSVALASPVLAGAGGALGGIALVAFAWWVPEPYLSRWTRIARRVVGLVLLVTALLIALGVWGLL